jgi:hypothetical protein
VLPHPTDVEAGNLPGGVERGQLGPQLLPAALAERGQQRFEFRAAGHGGRQPRQLSVGDRELALQIIAASPGRRRGGRQ